MKTKVTYRGWPGHYILSERCLFRLNTLVEYGEIRIVISTVGRLVTRDSDHKYEQVGCGRYYETMAFHAKFDGEFWDADVQRRVDFKSPWMCENVGDEMKAQNGHEAVVAEIVERLEKGEKFDEDNQ